MPALTVAEIAVFCDGKIEGSDERLVTGANTLENASEDQVSYVGSERAFVLAASSKAGCLLVPSIYPAEDGHRSLVRVRSPRTAFASLLTELYPKPILTPSVHPTAIISSSATISAGCFIGPYVSVGDGAQIGPRCVIHAGTRIGADVKIGADSILYPNVTVYHAVTIGDRAILHTGCVLGADGFGFTLNEGHYDKFPQVGTVRIGNDVEIGANSCVDRAALGVTEIGDGTKLDNLVHIGHNCVIGRHVVIAAQAGLSGSVMVGDYAAIGGQTGIGEKARIESKAIVGGKSGILTSQKIDSGEPVWGIPARPLRQHLKGLAHVARLDRTLGEIRALRSRLEELERKQS